MMCEFIFKQKKEITMPFILCRGCGEKVLLWPRNFKPAADFVEKHPRDIPPEVRKKMVCSLDCLWKWVKDWRAPKTLVKRYNNSHGTPVSDGTGRGG